MRRLLSAIVLGSAAVAAFGGGCSSSDDAPGSVADSGAASVDAAACTITEVKCGDSCVDLASDHDHCGSCTASCGDAQACRAGQCASCADLALDTCGTSCADLLADSAHCGACDKTCAVGQVCANGRCDTACPDAGVSCGASCVSVQTDPANCGTCGNACGAGQTCSDGACHCTDVKLVACGGTCTDPRADRQHCGATVGCGTTAGFVGEKCLASGYCQEGACQLCQTWSQGATVGFGASSNPIDVAVQDFNQDGKLDIAVLEAAASKIHMFLGKGDGTFTVGAIVSSGAGSAAMRIADFDGDSKLDIAIVNDQPTANRYVTILLGIGDGTFAVGPVINHVSPAETIAVGDLDGDNRPDLVIGGGGFSGSADVRTYLRKADGTYTRSATDYSTLFMNTFGSPYGVMQLADVDKDGHLDLVVNAGRAGILFGDGTGAFALGWTSPPFGVGGRMLAIADVNADGKNDLMVGSGGFTGLSVFLGAGGRTFGAGGAVRFFDVPSTRLLDVTGDGVLDLVETSGDMPSTFDVRAGKGDGTFLPEVSSPFDMHTNGTLAVGDLNGDGRLDVVALTYTGVRALLAAKSTAVGCP